MGDEKDYKCRLCLTEIEKSDNYFSVDDRGIREKMTLIFNFPIVPMDTLDVICKGCDAKVADFHAYHEQVRQNQDLLWRSGSVQKEECFETVKLEPAPLMDYEDFEQPIELLDDDKQLAVKGEPNDDDPMASGSNSTPPSECTVSDEEPETDPIMPRRRAKRRKLSDATAGRQQEPTSRASIKEGFEEQNRRLQEFYEMKCELCHEKLDCFTSLKNHYHKQHKVQGYINCCGRTFSSRYRLLEHLSFHVGSSMVRCDICNKSFSTRSYLQVHNSRMHGRAEDRPYKCTQCHQSYALECHLKAHMVTHVRVNCEICGKLLASSLSLRVHMVNIHGKRENLICDSCGKEFRTRQAFDRHVNLHLGIDPTEQVQCTLCSKWHRSKRALKVHVQLVHNEAGQTFKCDLCSHESPNSRAMANHKQRVHVGERFACEVCGKRFKRQLYLKEHIALHTGKPLYSCEICGATFNSNANKYSHRKNKHPVEWEARRKLLQQEASG
ncbi:transcription factor grauzone-like [Anopheles cruzii]|uniref:transcription factor grauzone-like n=1 Tax=Anopheles cruzii TaxID=68878 RepID=UPI0022EC2911|nr:transcription factor grauzone-like [Anopheles cruzii]